jgi:hypothetical protein
MGDTNRRYHLISVIRTAVHILSSLLTRTPLPLPPLAHLRLLVTTEQGQKLPPEVCCRCLSCLAARDNNHIARNVQSTLLAPENFAEVSFDAVTNDSLAYSLGDGHPESGARYSFRQHVEYECRRNQFLATLKDALVVSRLS